MKVNNFTQKSNLAKIEKSGKGRMKNENDCSRDIEVQGCLQDWLEFWTLHGKRSQRTAKEITLNGKKSKRPTV
jgi:hypothetical protein